MFDDVAILMIVQIDVETKQNNKKKNADMPLTFDLLIRKIHAN